jgi:hypothetical protein
MTPYKCPVCDGSGLVSRPPYVAGDAPVWTSTSCGPWTCRACSGTGIIWFNDSTRIVAQVNATLEEKP